MTIAIASFIVLLTALGVLFFEGSKKTVAMTLNGQKTLVKTHADTVHDLMSEMDVPLHSEDFLFPKADARVKNHLTVLWKQAKQVTLVKDNEKKKIWTTAGTVAELLKDQKMALNEHDKVSPQLQSAIKNKMEVHVKRAFRLHLVDGGKERDVWSTSTTVVDFLAQQGIRLNEYDRVEPSLNDPIKKDGIVNIIRVEKVTDVVEEPVEFAVVTKKDQKLPKGKEKILTQGRDGLVSKKYETILENGKEVARKLVDAELVRQRQNKVVAVGTKDFAMQVSRDNEQSGPEFYVTATAYTASCNGCSGRTATGLNIRSNPNMKVVAVDPRIIPLGTKVYVEGYGYAVAADTGGAINGYVIDVLMPSQTDAYRWGRKKVKIRILN